MQKIEIKEKKIKYSIITVTYNAASTLEETILSVIKQRNINYEYIIIDGGSKDSTIDIIKKYQDRIYYWISEKDKGIYDAMNKGLKIASGDFVIFLGADDHFLSYNTLEMTSKYINNIDEVYYGTVFRSKRNDLYYGKFNKYLISLENICHQTIFYPKCIYKKYEYNLNFNVYADYFYNLTLFPHYKFNYIPLTISYYTYDGYSSKVKDDNFHYIVDEYVKKELGYSCFILRKIYKFYKYIKSKKV